jgi:ferredoxin
MMAEGALFVASVDEYVCICSQFCQQTDPALFRINEEGIAEWSGGGSDRRYDELSAITSLCPQSAISVRHVGRSRACEE